jgi:hypothetical protein
MICGIEFEYMIIDMAGQEAGRIRDFGNLGFADFQALMTEKPGCGHPDLATGDLGIKSGYWYLEGDERFHEDGRFHEMAVKGIEIRTPPAPSVTEAIDLLLDIEDQLARKLAKHHLSLAIAGFNPLRSEYVFTPPLNAWEKRLRALHRSYDGSHISTLSYGPDINLSMPGWSIEESLDAAQKLNWYAPFIVPFSFSSPFFAGHPWHGYSKRTHARAPLRPAVKLYVAPDEQDKRLKESRLVYPARIPQEVGRIEFKAFDAHLSVNILKGCCHLLEGVCLATDLMGRSETSNVDLYQRAAIHGFGDKAILRGCGELLHKAKTALLRAGNTMEAHLLGPLEEMLSERITPAHFLLNNYKVTGKMYHAGGLGAVQPALSGFPEAIADGGVASCSQQSNAHV